MCTVGSIYMHMYCMYECICGYVFKHGSYAYICVCMWYANLYGVDKVFTLHIYMTIHHLYKLIPLKGMTGNIIYLLCLVYLHIHTCAPTPLGNTIHCCTCKMRNDRSLQHMFPYEQVEVTKCVQDMKYFICT